MIIELSKRLETTQKVYKIEKQNNSFNTELKKSLGIKNKYLFIFSVHLAFCFVCVFYAITITTFNQIEKEINEIERQISYELKSLDF